MENKCINLFLHGLCMWECHLSLGSVVPRNKRRSTTSLSVFIQWHTVLFNVYQARDGRGLVSQPSWFWLLVVRGGHQHTAEFWGAVGESSCRGGRSHSECQRKGEHASSEVYAISGVMFENALIWSPFFPFSLQVVIDAFRLINANMMVLGHEPRQTTSNLGHLNKPSIQVMYHFQSFAPVKPVRIQAWSPILGVGHFLKNILFWKVTGLSLLQPSMMDFWCMSRGNLPWLRYIMKFIS